MSFKIHGKEVCKKVELFWWMGYIPEEYNYITVDENMDIYIWKEKPEYLEGFWDKGGSYMLVGTIPDVWDEVINFEECLFELN